MLDMPLGAYDNHYGSNSNPDILQLRLRTMFSSRQSIVDTYTGKPVLISKAWHHNGVGLFYLISIFFDIVVGLEW